jgi:hypothetical protein
MVDVTYQMVLSTLQTVGILVGIIYYITIMRNTDKARKLQIAQRLYQQIQNKENQLLSIDLLEMEWENFDDFYRKYDSTVNKENFAKRATIFAIYEEMGFMLNQGMVDIETLYNLGGGQGILYFWKKFKPIILVQREMYTDPHRYRWLEYLAVEMMKERERQELPAHYTDPEGYTIVNP